MGYRLGVDVGGTFTDLLLFNTETGAFWRHKTPSTPHDSSEGILNGVTAICDKAGIKAGEIDYFLHGTTVATNAVLEGKGAKVGLVTTEGYRDILQIARSFVPGGLAAWIIWPKPQPLATLEDTVTVKGRMSAEGQEIRPLDEADVRAQLGILIKGPQVLESTRMVDRSCKVATTMPGVTYCPTSTRAIPTVPAKGAETTRCARTASARASCAGSTLR